MACSSIGAAELTISAPVDLSVFMVVVIWSRGSKVAVYVSDTLPSASVRLAVDVVKS